jgi:PAS domain S-box-containing protein
VKVRIQTGAVEIAELFTLLDFASDATFVVDITGEICYWSPKAERLLGFKKEQVLRKSCAEVLAGRDEAGGEICRNECAIFEVARKGGELTAYDLHTATASGRRKWLSTSILVAHVTTCASPLLVHLVRDIDHRKRIEGVTHNILVHVGHLTGNEANDLVRGGASDPPTDLTARELSVLRLLARGLSTRDIAHRLNVSPITARNHVQHILGKLGCHSRLEAVLTAVRRGVI